jgi:hypothetical protein
MSKKLYKRIANRLEDNWIPTKTFEEWQTRAQTRLKRDILEEENRLISIEDKKMQKAKNAYEKALITHRSRIEEIKETSRKKLEKAEEIGVFQGDTNNPIPGLKKALSESRKQTFELQKRAHDEPDYVHIGGKQHKKHFKCNNKGQNKHTCKIYKKQLKDQI